MVAILYIQPYLNVHQCLEKFDHYLFCPVCVALLDTVDFVTPDGMCQFRTCAEERGKVVFQMGTADPDLALQTARLVEDDVAGIDINMGCPKDFSIKGGMGAALLRNPEKIRAILTTLVKGVKKPITCKIRLLPSREDTVRLAKVIESTGVSAMAVHGRYKEERPAMPCHDELVREVAESVSIPVISNGGSLKICNYEDILAFREATGCSSVMVARAALQNPSIFRKEGVLPITDVAMEYVRTALVHDELTHIVKYCTSIMLKEFAKVGVVNTQWRDIAMGTLRAGSLREISGYYNMREEYEHLLRKREEKASSLPRQEKRDLEGVVMAGVPAAKRSRIETTEDGVHQLDVKYDGHKPGPMDTPKSQLLREAKRLGCPVPTFQVTVEAERYFRATVTFKGQKFSSTMLSKNKKGAEHSASIVALLYHNLLPDTPTEMTTTPTGTN